MYVCTNTAYEERVFNHGILSGERSLCARDEDTFASLTHPFPILPLRSSSRRLPLRPLCLRGRAASLFGLSLCSLAFQPFNPPSWLHPLISFGGQPRDGNYTSSPISFLPPPTPPLSFSFSLFRFLSRLFFTSPRTSECSLRVAHCFQTTPSYRGRLSPWTG